MIHITSVRDILIPEDLLDSFDRYQETKKVLAYQEGKFIEKEDHFKDDWTSNDKKKIVQHFQEVIISGGTVIIARQEVEVIGFAVIEPVTFGEEARYRELSYLHVSRKMRGKKVGEKLFQKVKEEAKQFGIPKLYIGAHPSIETQTFYRKMGCVPANEVNEEIYNREPLDVQLEITL